MRIGLSLLLSLVWIGLVASCTRPNSQCKLRSDCSDNFVCYQGWCMPSWAQERLAGQDASDHGTSEHRDPPHDDAATPPEPRPPEPRIEADAGSEPQTREQPSSTELFPEPAPEPACGVSCTPGDLQPCFPSDSKGCKPGGTGCVGDCRGGRSVCVMEGRCPRWGACQAFRAPQAEVCDGKDNDCDGSIDQGLTQECYTGPGFTRQHAPCKAGQRSCTNGAWGACLGERTPRPETCDGVDDDCDGSIDEGLSRSCFSGSANQQNEGICKAGVQVCSQGKWGLCVGEVPPQAQESCDGLDNNCNGVVDENCSCQSGQTQACGAQPGVSPCQRGSQTCTSQGIWGPCLGAIRASAEVCDGKDNDCNGAIDDQLQRSCYSGTQATQGVGPCKAGVQLCNNGQWGACNGAVLPQTETCNGQDDDCDGQTDEQLQRSCYTGPSGTAGAGACKEGSQSCVLGKWGLCYGEQSPQTEVCNGKDDDCDGKTDEELSRPCYSGPPSTVGRGLCQRGTQSCQSGKWAACQGQSVPQDETCDNGKDEDCDGKTDNGCVATFSGKLSTAGGFQDGAADAAQFHTPQGLASDASGKLYLADAGNHCIRTLDEKNGSAGVLVGSCGQPGSKDGKGSAPQLRGPQALLWTSNRLYIADTGNHCVRIYDPKSQQLSTQIGICGVAGSSDGVAQTGALLRAPSGLALTGRGAILVVDSGNHCIRSYDPSTDLVTTFAGSCGVAGAAGGKAKDARFSSPTEILVGAKGALYISDTANHCIRRIQGGQVQNVAGQCKSPGAQDGPQASASFFKPRGLAVDADALYIADSGNMCIRRLRFKDRRVSTLAGRCGETHKGTQNGSTKDARFSLPVGLLWGPQGQLLATEAGSHRIRRITLP